MIAETPSADAEALARLCERLERTVDSGRRAVGGGNISADGKCETWGGERIMVLANPDGPEAAAQLRASLAREEAHKRWRGAIEEASMRLRDELLVSTDWLPVAMMDEAVRVLKAETARATALERQLEEALVERDYLKTRAANSIQFAGGQSPHVCGSGSISATKESAS